MNFYLNPDGPDPLSGLLEEFYDDSTWREKLTGAAIN
jgi:hypothetical protein